MLLADSSSPGSFWVPLAPEGPGLGSGGVPDWNPALLETLLISAHVRDPILLTQPGSEARTFSCSGSIFISCTWISIAFKLGKEAAISFDKGILDVKLRNI